MVKKTVLGITNRTCVFNERGLGAIQLHPKFDSNGWIYIYYTFPKYGNCDEENRNSGPVNRLSRWVWNADLNEIDPKSEVVYFETLPLSKRYHNSGKY